MVSFRFHLVSLVAVFLALGLGVLTGTTVLNRGIVAQLERQTDQLVGTSNRLREDVRRLQSESDGWNRFGGEVRNLLLTGRLRGEDVVLVTQEGTDSAGIDRVRRGLEMAGAEVAAVLSISGRMRLEAPGDIRNLAELLGSASEDPEELEGLAAEAIAERLVSRPESEDPLEGFLSAGFLRNRGPGLGGAALRELGGPGQVVVVVGGGIGEPIVEPQRFLVPLVQGLAERGSRVAAAEGTRSEYQFVGLIRGDGAISRLVVTQDNVDQLPGEISLVLALDDLVDRGEPGHYGVKDGADAVVPPLS